MAEGKADSALLPPSYPLPKAPPHDPMYKCVCVHVAFKKEKKEEIYTVLRCPWLYILVYVYACTNIFLNLECCNECMLGCN